MLAAGDLEGLPYYTMPFVEGESLRARLGRGPLPIAEAVSILRESSRALAYAHEHGVVHRDIKPDNVLLSGHTAVVTDFGIAKAIAAAASTTPSGATLTQLGTAIGTPAYMAPEQAAGDPATDHRADIYAFGCVAYELLAGQPPFPGLPPHKLLVAHMSETPKPGRRRCVPTVRRRSRRSSCSASRRIRRRARRARPSCCAVLDVVASPSAPQAAMPAILDRRPRNAHARARGVRRRVHRRRDRRARGDHRDRTSRLGVPRRARRHGARAAGDPVHGVRAVRLASHGDGDADVHAGRHAVARRRAGHDGDARDQGEPARVVEARDARRHHRGERVRAAGRRRA